MSRLIAELRAELQGLSTRPTTQEIVALLLRAGELECGLADASSGDADWAAQLTDLLAQAAVRQDLHAAACEVEPLSTAALRILNQVRADGTITISTPEGFAYYALHPLDYSDLAGRDSCDGAALVIGIRSIGTTLSAVVTAKLRQSGVAAQRITVRPQGHPYDRTCAFDWEQRQKIRSALVNDAAFVVCDEGPGLSGSSFLSVAEALEAEGVRPERITLFCSYQPDLSSLRAPDAARRWSRYRSVASGMTQRLPSKADLYLGGGTWRSRLSKAGGEYPAAWPTMERLKYLSSDGQLLVKFEGHGHYGDWVRLRNQALSDSQFGATYLGNFVGFGRHLMLNGRMGRVTDLSSQLLSQMARYCAWRTTVFPVTDVDANELQEMTAVNCRREFGFAPADSELQLVRPVVADGRMQPHEWFLDRHECWAKLDAATHGDDHFFPGPCDIAWDLAGTTVEWGLDASARSFFLSEYRRLSSDDPAARLPSYELAYATFRFAWSKMAAAAMQGTADKARLLRDYRRYRQAAVVLAERQQPLFTGYRTAR